MSIEEYKYVIIGGGVAAGYAAQTIAEHGDNASSQLCILSSDSQLPYEWPSLAKQFLAGNKMMSDILINEPDFYTEHGIDIRLRTVVGRVDCTEEAALLGADNQLAAAFVLNRPDEEAQMAPTWIRNRTTLDPEPLGDAESLRGAGK